MKVQEGSLVSIYYRVTDDEGRLVEEVSEGNPLTFKVGSGQVSKVVEDRIIGMEENEEKEFTLSPEEGYGPYREDLVKRIPKEAFPGDVREGEVYKTDDLDGNPIFFVIRGIEGDFVLADFNHPLAGKSLNIHIKVVHVE